MTYPHKQLVIAWLDGKTIQYVRGCDPSTGWLNLPNVDVSSQTPGFFVEGWSYRLKPDMKKIQYRTALCRAADAYYVASVSTPGAALTIEGSPDFVKWFDDWQEAEFEV